MICSTSLNQLPRFGIHRVAIACGVFDGLHIGHQEIIRTLIEKAQSTSSVPVAITFEPHPEVIVNSDSAPKRLFSREHQLKLLKKLGIGVTVVFRFTRELACLSPEEFIKKMILVNDLRVTSFCMGAGWRFGHQARGDVNLLRELGNRFNFDVQTVPNLIMDAVPISSTRVRTALSNGNLELVRKLLGRNFSILGQVEFGKGIATTDLSYPTANICSGQEVYPPYGVYASKVHLYQKNDPFITKEGALYIGESPTYVNTPPEKPFIEIHIFDFLEDIYGQTIEVELLRFLRGDLKFDSANSLRHQITEDIKAVKEGPAPDFQKLNCTSSDS